MKVYFAFAPLVLVLFFPVSLRAQNQEGPLNRKQFPRLNQIGFTLGLGSNKLKLNELNQRLADLQIGTLDPSLVAFNASLHGVFNQGYEVSMDLNAGGTSVEKLNYFLRLRTFSLGFTFYRSLLQTNRFNVLIALGYRMTDINLGYNVSARNAANFDSLFTPAANSANFRIASQSNQAAPVGIRFQYRLHKLYPDGLGKTDSRVGFDAGYNYSIGAEPWFDAGNGRAVANMPTVRPDYFYLLVNLSVYFNR